MTKTSRNTPRGPALGVGLAATTAAAGAGAAWLAQRRREVHRLVPADLRHPALLAPVTFDARTVPLVRRSRYATSVPLDVAHEVREVPRTAAAPAVPLNLYRPRTKGSGRPAVLFVHGGGYVMESPVIYHDWCSLFVQRLGAVVVSVDYRLAPEHPFPAPLDDCHAALLWLRDHADELGVDPDRVALAGDSAGGGLAAALAQRAHDEDIPVAFQALVYPMLDDRTCQREPGDGQGVFVWTQASNRYGWSSYLGHPAGEGTPPPYAVPARRTDLAGLPPAWIGVGTLDLFHTEDLRYAERLQRAGVSVTVTEVPGLYHGAPQIRPSSRGSRQLLEAMVTALAHGLGTSDSLAS